MSSSSPLSVHQQAAAEGLYSGTSAANERITGVVLETGAYYVFFGPPGGAAGVAGVVTGTGISDGGTFSSSDGRAFDMLNHSVTSASLSATYVAKQSLDGSVSINEHSPSFTSAYNTLYDQAPSMTSLAGAWSGQAASTGGLETSSLTVSASGAISGTTSTGCAFTGELAPHGNHGGVYDISLSFGAAPCPFASSSLSGIAVFDPAAMTLVAAAPDATGTDGVLISAQMERPVVTPHYRGPTVTPTAS
ncbi:MULTISPECIES: hypothetical protein [Paraburkholderia]|uniref:hypothetical protein n=1 Tax=Paraburkholderia TaxID=1822464 RepID=UPI0013A6E918|nr:MULTISPECIES: hypothetical protein [Paraburkholderia]